MVKTFNNPNFSFDSTSITTEDLEWNIPEPVELEGDDMEMYRVLFEKESAESVGVRKPLQECLQRFVEIGLLEDGYHKFVKLCHQAIDKKFDSVEKDGLQVINNSGDVELICADKSGEWQVICTIEKELIEKFYKNKDMVMVGRAVTNPSGGTVTIEMDSNAPSTTHWWSG